LRLTSPPRSFTLLNLRQAGRFWYIRGSLGSPVAVASSDPVAFAHPNEPTGVHTALTGAPGGVVVSWVSASAAGATVLWGAGGAALEHSTPATSLTYAPADLCGVGGGIGDRSVASVAAGWGYFSPGYLHSATLDAGALPRGSTLDYRVGSTVSNDWSATFQFSLPPARGAPVRVLAVADLGVAEADGSSLVAGNPAGSAYQPDSYFNMLPSLNNTRRMSADVDGGRTLVLHNGDLSYAMGYVAMWDTFGAMLQPAASRVPWMVAVGNHEHNFPGNPYARGSRYSAAGDAGVADSGGECGLPTALRFPMPPPMGRGAGSPWYSFDYGVVHFTTVSTEHPLGPGSAQYAWLEADLAAAAAARDAAELRDGGRSATAPRWLVMNGHRPFYIHSPYNTGKQPDTPIALEMAAALEPLWQRYGVDLTLTGHHHSYQRSLPIAYGAAQGECVAGQPRGTVHVVIGHGGAGFSGISADDPQAALFVLAQNSVHGYARLDADGETLRLQSVDGASGAEQDAFTLAKPAGPRNCFAAAPAPPAPAPAKQADRIGDDLLLAVIISGIVVVAVAAAAYWYKRRAARRAQREHDLLDTYAELGDDEEAAEGKAVEAAPAEPASPAAAAAAPAAAAEAGLLGEQTGESATPPLPQSRHAEGRAAKGRR